MNVLANTIATFDDYHEGEQLAREINKVFITKLKTEEIGFNDDDGQYYILFWTGKKPTKQTIKTMAKELFGIALEDLV